MYEKPFENIILPISTQKNIPSATDIWASSKYIDAYTEYRSDGNSDKINPCLRNGTPLDSLSYDIVMKMDELFKTMPAEYCPIQNEVVYRGIYIDDVPKETRDIITQKDGNNSCFVDKAIISTSKNYNTAKDFSRDSVLLKITLPNGSKRFDPEKLPKPYRNQLADVEREVLLPRNSKFRVDNYNPETGTAEITYMGQEFPLPTITEKFDEDTPSYDKYEKVLNAYKFYKLNGKR